MIVLNSNKELIRVEKWADIEARPGFTSDLNSNEHVLASIIGRYSFSNQIRCGLSNCHTLHARGYIVTTSDGHETNIGKDCGRKYFGVDFETLTRQFDQDITDKENRDRLWSFRCRIDELKGQIHLLRSQPRGADWIHRKTSPLLGDPRIVPSEVVRRIAEMIKNRQNILYIDREATEAEIEQLEASRGRSLPRPHYVQEPIGHLNGLDALYPENNVRQLVVIDIEEKLKAFEQLSIDNLNSAMLTRWNKWVTSVDPTLNRATAAVESGRRLLRRENLEQLIPLLKDIESLEKMKKYILTIGSTE